MTDFSVKRYFVANFNEIRRPKISDTRSKESDRL
jgi:hypothetical protein